ncbi:hypothetical protein [Posidoniimonas corsicana]|nr:hypothetical protein [Posidoniimonas corsicana]
MPANPDASHDQPPCVERAGAWPFTTRRVHRMPSGELRAWSSRHDRKRLAIPGEAPPWRPWAPRLWLPRSLNWWIGGVFAVGASLFVVGSLLTLAPGWADRLALTPAEVNSVYFAGSIPFTAAAYLQLWQAANTGGPPRRFFGWRPRDAGWLSCALQFAGTVLFNLNTFDAMLPGLGWFAQDLLVWTPNLVGSVLFLASGYLAYIEAGHAHLSWRPRDLSWWVVAVNLLGCFGFMASALLAAVPPGADGPWASTPSVVWTLFGAVGFLIGALLMQVEAAQYERP